MKQGRVPAMTCTESKECTQFGGLKWWTGSACCTNRLNQFLAFQEVLGNLFRFVAGFNGLE